MLVPLKIFRLHIVRDHVDDIILKKAHITRQITANLRHNFN